ncbi:MAG TPA: M20/M25/M40 family metallo-hydrolase [Opitutaceae bacterium]
MKTSPLSRPLLVVLTGTALGLATGCTTATRPAAPAATPSSLVTEASVRGHMTFLASDALNGRGSGTRDEWIAATYAGSQMQSWGLEPTDGSDGFVQKIEIERAEAVAAPVLVVGETRLTHGTEMIVQGLGAARLTGPLQKYQPGVAVIPGALLLLPASGAPTVATAGAGALLTVETPQARTRWAVLGARMPTTQRILGTPVVPPARVILGQAAYDSLSALADGTSLTLEAELKEPQKILTWNAVGQIRGTAANAGVILLSAHIDHLGVRPARPEATSPDTIYNGADDDASGSIAVLELARAFVQGPRPKRTLIFALFGSEEAGGFGSRYFADHPTVPLNRIVANLQFEMIGRPDAAIAAQTLWLTGYERSTLGPELANRGARLVQDPHPDQSFFTRSDNIQFARRGVIAHTVSSFGLHSEYHQPSDEISLVDFPHMTTAINSMVEPIRWLANADFVPTWLPGQQP